MYCVKCGVKLQDGVESCPLCGTPVWNPDPEVSPSLFSDRMPEQVRRARSVIALACTGLLIVGCLVVAMICRNLYGSLAWGGYAILGSALFYCILILPLWFRDPNPVIFLPVDHAAIAGYLLYICIKTGGDWFLPFAFPVTLASAVISTAAAALLRYVKGGRFFIFGGISLVCGVFMFLIELFEHIAFGFAMFRWSMYPAAVFGILGLFLLLAGMIRPLGDFLSKKFYL